MASVTPESSAPIKLKSDSIFRNRTFASVWIGSILSTVGDGFHSVALGLLVLQKTGSGASMSAIFAARFLASILLGPIAGTISDRVDRRRLMLLVDVLRALLVLCMFYLASASAPNVLQLVVLSFVLGICSTFFFPAFSASLSNMLPKEQLPRASSLLQLTGTVSQMVGPALAGLLIAFTSGANLLLIDAASFAASAVTLLIVRFQSPVQDPRQRKFFWQDLQDGFSYLVKQPVIFGVTLLGPAFSLFGAAHTILISVIAVRFWHTSSFEYGILQTSWPLGTAVAAAFLTFLSALIKRRGALIVTVFSLAGALYMIAPVMPTAWTAYPFLIGSGILAGGGITTMIILLRTVVPTEFQGRVFGFYGSLANAAWPLGSYLAGVLGDSLSPVSIAVICGAGFLFTGLCGLFNRPLRTFE